MHDPSSAAAKDIDGAANVITAAIATLAYLARVASIEQNLGIYDRGQFTLQVGPFLPGT